MNIPCPNFTLCLLVNPPYNNLSSEGGDAITYIGGGGGSNDTPVPPLGSNWQADSCLGLCVSEVSQEDADLCAYNNSLLCLYDHPGDDPYTLPDVAPPDADPDDPTNPDSTYTIYYNDAKTGTSSCADGTYSYYTMPANSIAALSKAQANAMAQSLAQIRANSKRICLSELYGPCVTGTDPLILYITASGFPVDPGTSGGAGYNLWKLLSGTLPPGMRLLVQHFFDVDASGISGGATITLEGTPTTPGDYQFTVQVSSPTLNPYTVYTAKTYNVEVLDPMAPNADYSITLSKPACAGTHSSHSMGGTLNEGLSWSQDISGNDLIEGTPTVEGTCMFSLTY